MNKWLVFIGEPCRICPLQIAFSKGEHMRYAVLAVLIFALPACKGPKGETGNDGSRGPAGPSGPSGQIPNAPDILTFEGNVTSNDQFVFIGDTGTNYALSVYIGAGSSYSELPYFLPAQGVNAFFIASGTQVELVNAQLAAATKYRIVLVRVGAAAGLSDGILN